MANRLKNLTAAFSNVKIRTIMILTVIVLALVIVVGFLGLHRASQINSTAQLTKASNLQSIPGIKATSPQYAQTQQEVNQQNYQAAEATHGTNIPTIINQQGLATNNNPGAYNLNGTGTGTTSGENGGSDSSSSPGSTTGENTASADQLKALEAQQKTQMDTMQKKLDELSSQQEQQQLQQTQASMQKEAQQLLSAWNSSSNNPTQQYVQGNLATEKNKTSTTSTSTSSSTFGSNNGPTLGGVNQNNQPMIKSGAILFGVLDTAVNSDEPGPVLVTIVTGQYKGSKLIGSIQSSPQIPGSNGPTKLILNFSTMNVPYLPQSISVSAVAIDPDTARTALASDVDHHYVERYGSLFASSFLEGYGQAVTQAGSTTTVSPFGGTNTTYSALSGKEEIAAGLGQVGESWGQQLGDTFNRQNTVTINSGVSVGILFLSDVSQGGTNTPTAPATMNQVPAMAGSSGAVPGATTTVNMSGTSATPVTAVETGNVPMPVPVPTQ